MRRSHAVRSSASELPRALVDQNEADFAIEAYRHDHASRCENGSLDPSVCESPPTIAPIATGRFLGSTQSVFLKVPTDQGRAGGEEAIVLMRRTGGQYEVAGEVLSANGFDKIFRAVQPDGNDSLFLCTANGQQGEYYGECGFLTERGFTQPRAIGYVTTCGESAETAVESVTQDPASSVVTVRLSTRRISRTAAADDEGEFCSNRVETSVQIQDIRYVFRSGGFQVDG